METNINPISSSSRNITFKLVDVTKDSADYDAVKQIRVVLSPGNSPAELKAYHNDDKCSVYLMLVDDEPVGTLRINFKPDGYKFERIAIVEKYQGKGLGKELLMGILKIVQGKTPHIYIHSRIHMVPFYVKCGFQTVGELFFERICDHFKMVYSQTPAAN